MISIRTVLVATALAGAMLASPSAAFAQGTSKQRSACMGDAFRFCSSAIPNVSKITACMRSNFSKLSPGCKAVFPKD
jgi:hypothetical protein